MAVMIPITYRRTCFYRKRANPVEDSENSFMLGF